MSRKTNRITENLSKRPKQWLLIGITAIILSIVYGCASLSYIPVTYLGKPDQSTLDMKYGVSTPEKRLVRNGSTKNLNEQDLDYWHDVKPIIEKRCVICHGCYDAPCQLRMDAIEGFERGAHKKKVYDGSRLIAAELTRLFEDADSIGDWRNKGFFPVLNERDQTETANLNAGLIARSLQLKRDHPPPVDSPLPDNFDFSLDRHQQCPTVEEYDQFTQDYPLWGMPYGLPNIPDHEYQILMQWLSQGALYDQPMSLEEKYQKEIAIWERFLNGGSLKQQLVSRYIYEHLFLANLYFDRLGERIFFRLVRSRTGPGLPIDRISTRRPYDDPMVTRVYYRFQPMRSTVLAKTHQVYALNDERMTRYTELFFTPEYQVNELPSYDPELSANPFSTFKAIPVRSRYKFLLDEAQFIIMGFIKGPVCRGQVALNVINDRFWVAFIDPDTELIDKSDEFLANTSEYLSLPSEAQSNAPPLLTWIKYSHLHHVYLDKKNAYLMKNSDHLARISMDVIWDGGGVNENAALTVFRHFDSASVVKGFVGEQPKTMWVISYSLLERIHYLLVAGFDVYGNVGHQLNARLHMDYLRMEGESNFLSFLPKEDRIKTWHYWYRDMSYFMRKSVQPFGKFYSTQASEVLFKTENSLSELMSIFQQKLASIQTQKYSVNHNEFMQHLAGQTGPPLSFLSQVSLITVVSNKRIVETYTLIRNDAHSNISSLLLESNRRLPNEDTLTVVRGYIGAYPNTLFRVESNQLPKFVDDISKLSTGKDYQRLLDNFGVRRTNTAFWQHSDKLHNHYIQTEPIEAGLFDFNRLENR